MREPVSLEWLAPANLLSRGVLRARSKTHARGSRVDSGVSGGELFPVPEGGLVRARKERSDPFPKSITQFDFAKGILVLQRGSGSIADSKREEIRISLTQLLEG